MNSRRSPKASRRRPRLGACVLGAGLAGLVALAALATTTPPILANEAGFDRAIRQNAARCTREPATDCAARLFALADSDQNGLVDVREFAALDRKLRQWSQANPESLDTADRKALRLGFLLVDAIGLERGVALYDEDGDGALSFAEAAADLELDERPMPELIRKRELVDWPAVGRRLGPTAMLLDYLDIR